MSMAARRGRNLGIAAASVVVHAILIAVVAAQAPRLFVPPGASGPPEPVIPVLIMPRTPPAAAGVASQPSPIRLHRRPQRFAPPITMVTPLAIPQAGSAKSSPAPAARITALPSSRDVVAEGVNRTLRGRLGCANPSMLSPAEREACEDRLAAGAHDAPFAGLGLARGKTAGFDAAAAAKAADVRYKQSGGFGVGTIGTGRNSGVIEQPGAANLGIGANHDTLGRLTGNDKPDLKIPF